jgi:hypothetical protein
MVVLLSIIKQKQNIRRKGACCDFMMRESGPRRRSMRTTTGGAAALLTGRRGAVADGGGSSMEQWIKQGRGALVAKTNAGSNDEALDAFYRAGRWWRGGEGRVGGHRRWSGLQKHSSRWFWRRGNGELVISSGHHYGKEEARAVLDFPTEKAVGVHYQQCET